MSLDDPDKNWGGVHPDGLKLGLVSFLTDLISKIILLVFAMFSTPIGGASAALLDMVEGLGDLSALSLNYFAGWLSDRTGKRKAFALAGYGFSTLAHNVFEGRHFCDNLRKGVKDYLAVKGGLIAIFLLPVLAGLPLPFSPIQIIVLVMFMDLAASAGFVAEPSEADITRRRPRHTATALIEGAAVRNILLKGVLLFAAVIAGYAWAHSRRLSPPALQTCAFAAWMVGHVALAFVSRSNRNWIARYGLFSNRIMN